MDAPRPPTSITSTTGSVVGLVAGLAIGSYFQGATEPVVTEAAGVIGALGTVWVRALQMTVLPLVITQLVAAVCAGRDAARVGRMLAAAVALFLVLLGLAGTFTVAATVPILESFHFDPDTVAALKTNIPKTAHDLARTQPADLSLTGWLTSLVPTNPFRAAVNGEFLQVIVFTLLFALAVTRLDAERRRPVAAFFQGAGDAMFVLVSWLLRLARLGVFAVSFTFAREAGIGVAGILLQFVVLLSGLMVAFTLLLYPIAVLLGGARLWPFARALYPGQVVALSTRSSLAALPALMEGAKRHLDLPPATLGFALPFAASAFKVNRTISGPAGLLFLAHMYGIELHAMQIVTFILTVMILSFSSPGIPAGGDTFKTLPAYLAAGLPIEGVVLIKAADVIPDIFKTLVNVTGYMTVAVLLGRLFAERPEKELASPPLEERVTA